MSETAPVGRPPYVPTDEDKQLVSKMVICGVTHTVISQVLKICKDTLYKYYQYELDAAKALVVTEIGMGLVERARNGDAVAQMFYLKTQGDWKEKAADDDKSESKAEQYVLRKL